MQLIYITIVPANLFNLKTCCPGWCLVYGQTLGWSAAFLVLLGVSSVWYPPGDWRQSFAKSFVSIVLNSGWGMKVQAIGHFVTCPFVFKHLPFVGSKWHVLNMQTIPICKYHHSESNRKRSRGPHLLSRGYERLDVINKLKLNSRKMKFLLVQKPTSFFPILLALTYALGRIVFSVKEDVWNFSWIHNYFHQ